jgi:RNA polymerase sigma factor (TIGR02999 family)
MNVPMNEPRTPEDVTVLLQRLDGDDRDRAVLDLVTAVYDDLRRLAARHLQGERRDHTLQPTALVHEAYVKLIGQRENKWQDRQHFFAVMSTLIRRILVDHARSRDAAKRGGDRARHTLDDADAPALRTDCDLVELDEVLERLASIDPNQARIVEMRFFGGLAMAQIAEALGIGRRTVDREWACARAWIHRQLTTGGPGDDDLLDERSRSPRAHDLPAIARRRT